MNHASSAVALPYFDDAAPIDDGAPGGPLGWHGLGAIMIAAAGAGAFGGIEVENGAIGGYHIGYPGNAALTRLWFGSARAVHGLFALELGW